MEFPKGKRRMHFCVRFKASGHAYWLPPSEHGESLFFAAIASAAGLGRGEALKVLQAPGGKIETADFEFTGRWKRCPENSSHQQFARFAATI